MAEATVGTASYRILDLLKNPEELLSKQSDENAGEFYLQDLKMDAFLDDAGLDKLIDKFKGKAGSYSTFREINHTELIRLGVQSSRLRIRFLAFLNRFLQQLGVVNVMGVPPKKTKRVELQRDSDDFKKIETSMKDTIVQHEDDIGGKFRDYQIIKIERLDNEQRAQRFDRTRTIISEDIGVDAVNEKTVFHGSLYVESVADEGFDIRYANKSSMFGGGLYYAKNSSKSNLYVFGKVGSRCPKHDVHSCYDCVRKMLVCQVILGRSLSLRTGTHYCHAPQDHESITGEPSSAGLNFVEYIVFKDEQAIPTHVVSYKIIRPE